MADILGGIVYASIMATLATLKDECKNRDNCIDCPFRTNYSMCLFDTVPEEYDLTKISEALKKDGDSK